MPPTRILAVDAARARDMPSVVAVAMGLDLAQWTKPLIMPAPIDGLQPVTVETLLTGKVRFNGDLVACVVAETAITTAGEPQGHFATAYRVLEARFSRHRQTHAPMEPRSCRAD